MTDSAFRDHNDYKIITVRVHRKSDMHYWTCNVRTFQAKLPDAINQIQAWANGLAIHPNFECVTFVSVELSSKVAEDFDAFAEKLRAFL